jgi:hypothetical protein
MSDHRGVGWLDNDIVSDHIECDGWMDIDIELYEDGCSKSELESK